MYGLVAIISAGVTIASFVYFQQAGSHWSLASAVLFLIVTVVTGGVFLSSKVNRKEDIHITE